MISNLYRPSLANLSTGVLWERARTLTISPFDDHKLTLDSLRVVKELWRRELYPNLNFVKRHSDEYVQQLLDEAEDMFGISTLPFMQIVFHSRFHTTTTEKPADTLKANYLVADYYRSYIKGLADGSSETIPSLMRKLSAEISTFVPSWTTKQAIIVAHRAVLHSALGRTSNRRRATTPDAELSDDDVWIKDELLDWDTSFLMDEVKLYATYIDVPQRLLINPNTKNSGAAQQLVRFKSIVGELWYRGYYPYFYHGISVILKWAEDDMITDLVTYAEIALSLDDKELNRLFALIPRDSTAREHDLIRVAHAYVSIVYPASWTQSTPSPYTGDIETSLMRMRKTIRLFRPTRHGLQTITSFLHKRSLHTESY